MPNLLVCRNNVLKDRSVQITAMRNVAQAFHKEVTDHVMVIVRHDSTNSGTCASALVSLIKGDVVGDVSHRSLGSLDLSSLVLNKPCDKLHLRLLLSARALLGVDIEHLVSLDHSVEIVFHAVSVFISVFEPTSSHAELLSHLVATSFPIGVNKGLLSSRVRALPLNQMVGVQYRTGIEKTFEVNFFPWWGQLLPQSCQIGKVEKAAYHQLIKLALLNLVVVDTT